MKKVKTAFERGWDDFEEGIKFNPQETVEWQKGWNSANSFWHG